MRRNLSRLKSCYNFTILFVKIHFRQLIKLVPDQSLPNDLKKKADKEKIAKASWKEMEERMKDWNEQVALIRYVKLRIEKGF